jgi:hypothetical protein
MLPVTGAKSTYKPLWDALPNPDHQIKMSAHNLAMLSGNEVVDHCCLPCPLALFERYNRNATHRSLFELALQSYHASRNLAPP